MNRLGCLFTLLATVAIAATPACKKDDSDDTKSKKSSSKSAGKPPVTPDAFDVVALGAGNELYVFRSDNPSSTRRGKIEGANAEFEGIDVRPSDGLLYGLTTEGKLYQIELKLSGDNVSAKAVGGRKVADVAVGQGVAFDFNPKSKVEPDQGNALRVITPDTNSRLNPATAAIAGTDKPLVYRDDDENQGLEPKVVAAGYLNSFAGTDATVLFDIDTSIDALVRQGDPDPNEGVLVTVGYLGIDVGDVAGFDIVTTSTQDNKGLVNQAFLVSEDTFYEVDLDSGEADEVGPVGGVGRLRGVAVLPPTKR